MTDLTTEEQARVRKALRFLRTRAGGWGPLATALGFTRATLTHVSDDRSRVVTASLAFRLARLAMVPVDDLLAWKYPPANACPHCGHVSTDG